MSEVVKIELTGLIMRIREAVEESEQPDAVTIAHELCETLSAEEIEEALRRGVRLLVEREARSQRAQALRAAREERVPPRADPSKKAQRQLANVTAEHQRRQAEKFFKIWKETPTGRKFLGECTVEDLRYSADRHRDRSEQALHHAACDEALAKVLADSDVATVRELGYETAAAAHQAQES